MQNYFLQKILIYLEYFFFLILFNVFSVPPTAKTDQFWRGQIAAYCKPIQQKTYKKKTYKKKRVCFLRQEHWGGGNHSYYMRMNYSKRQFVIKKQFDLVIKRHKLS